MISVLYWAHLFMKYCLGISDFLEEISSLSRSIIFLHFFELITEESFLISPCYSLELCIQMLISFLFLLCFSLLFFSELFVRPPQTIILPFCISFSSGCFWLPPPVQYYETLSIVLQALCLPLTKRGPLEKGMANHFSILASKTP